jgi:hypothetical protein
MLKVHATNKRASDTVDDRLQKLRGETGNSTSVQGVTKKNTVKSKSVSTSTPKTATTATNKPTTRSSSLRNSGKKIPRMNTHNKRELTRALPKKRR